MVETKGIMYIRMMLDILAKKEAQLISLLKLTAEQEKILKEAEFSVPLLFLIVNFYHYIFLLFFYALTAVYFTFLLRPSLQERLSS